MTRTIAENYEKKKWWNSFLRNQPVKVKCLKGFGFQVSGFKFQVCQFIFLSGNL